RLTCHRWISPVATSMRARPLALSESPPRSATSLEMRLWPVTGPAFGGGRGRLHVAAGVGVGGVGEFLRGSWAQGPKRVGFRKQPVLRAPGYSEMSSFSFRYVIPVLTSIFDVDLRQIEQRGVVREGRGPEELAGGPFEDPHAAALGKVHDD